MSTSYRFFDSIKKQKFINAIKKVGLSIAEKNKDSICVTDGDCYLWFYIYDGQVMNSCRYGANYNAVDTILEPLAQELNTDFISEHDEGYFDDDDIDDDAC